MASTLTPRFKLEAPDTVQYIDVTELELSGRRLEVIGATVEKVRVRHQSRNNRVL
jgi:hypothetical protein